MSAANIHNVEELLEASSTKLADTIDRILNRAIEVSYLHRGCRRTGNEDKRRLELCFDVIRHCQEAEQPIHRVMDVMNELLIMAIDGREIIIQSGGLWCVSGSGLEVPISKDVMEKQPDINTQAIECDGSSIKNPSTEQVLAAMEENERRG